MNAKLSFSDAGLVAAIQDKKNLDQAIEYLYREHAGITSSFIMGRGGNEQDADDIFQETVVAFIDTVQKGKFRAESGVRTFLIAISKNLWMNEMRKRQRADNREKLYETGRGDQEEAAASEAIGDRELKQMLQQLLDNLGDSCKQILTLFYYDNLPMKEIVSHMHYENEQVVRNKKYKCLQQLTGMMKENPAAAKHITELLSK